MISFKSMPFVVNTYFCLFDATLKKKREKAEQHVEKAKDRQKKRSKKVSNPRKQHRDSL